MSVKIEGLRDLEFALRELPKATAKAALQRTLKKAAIPVQQNWKGKAPRDRGDYADSIIVGAHSKLNRTQRRAARQDGKHFAEIHVGTDDPAGVQQEFGNINHPAQPSGRPAWEEEQDGALRTISEELGGEIEKSRARLAKKAARLAAKG